MIIRQFAPRQCRNAFFRNAQLVTAVRFLATAKLEPRARELDVRLSEETSIAKGNQAPQLLPQDETTADNVADSFLALKHMQKTTGRFGGDVVPHYHPRQLLSNPPRAQDVTLELLLASQTHLGHSTSLWHPANSRYIFGIRDGIHIISLDITAAHLRRAARVVAGVAERGGLILFVGTRDGQERCVVKAADMAGAYHLFQRWTPGGITNADQIFGRSRLKVVNELDEEVTGYETQLQDRGSMKPDLVICLNPVENYVLLHECSLANIPTIGVIDTDANPTWVTYPIPANDDSIRSIHVIAGVLGRAGQEGREERLEKAKRGVIPYDPVTDLQPPEEEESKGEELSEEQEHGARLLTELREGGSPPSEQHYMNMSPEDKARMEEDLLKGRVRMGDNKASIAEETDANAQQEGFENSSEVRGP